MTLGRPRRAKHQASEGEYQPGLAAAIDAALRREAEEYVDGGITTRAALRSGKPLKVLPAPNQSATTYFASAKDLRAALGAVSRERYRSQLEADYAALLRGRKMVGEILEWWYEPFTLHLGGVAGTKGGVKYRIDFLILMANRELEIHETKGFFRRGERERLKLAAAKFPFIVKAITRNAEGGWDEELF